MFVNHHDQKFYICNTDEGQDHTDQGQDHQVKSFGSNERTPSQMCDFMKVLE